MAFERVSNGLENLGLCHTCAGELADQYIKNPKSDSAKLVNAALAGDKNALAQLNKDSNAATNVASASQSPSLAPDILFFSAAVLIICISIAALIWVVVRDMRKQKLVQLTQSRLIVCKDCHKEYSPDAARCIHCGAYKPADLLPKSESVALRVFG